MVDRSTLSAFPFAVDSPLLSFSPGGFTVYRRAMDRKLWLPNASHLMTISTAIYQTASLSVGSVLRVAPSVCLNRGDIAAHSAKGEAGKQANIGRNTSIKRWKSVQPPAQVTSIRPSTRGNRLRANLAKKTKFLSHLDSVLGACWHGVHPKHVG